MCPSFFRKWKREHSVDVITVSCEFVFYRVFGEVVDGDVSGSGFSVDVNFQFVFQIIHRSRKCICVLFSYVGLSCSQLWMLFM
jgi:hypothetical protein